MKRNSKILIVSNGFEMLVASTILYIALFGAFAGAEGVWRWVTIIAIVYFTWTRIYGLFYEWLSIRFKIEKDQIVIKRGIFSQSVTYLAWEDVRSVNTDANFVLQRTGLCRVHILALGSASSSVRIGAISEELASQIANSVKCSSKETKSQEKPGALERELDPININRPSGEVFKLAPSLSASDHFAIGFTYGKFILVVPAVASVLTRVMELQGIEVDLLSDLRTIQSWELGHKVVLGALVTLAGIAYGGAMSAIKYYGFRLEYSDGEIIYSRGLFQTARRRVPISNVITVTVKQNILMRILSRYQVVTISGASSGEQDRHVVAPLVTRSDAEYLVDSLVKYGAGGRSEVQLSSSGARVLANLLLMTILFYVAIYGQRNFVHPGGWGLVLVSVWALIVIQVLNSAVGKAAVVEQPFGRVMKLDKGWMWRYSSYVKFDAVESSRLSDLKVLTSFRMSWARFWRIGGSDIGVFVPYIRGDRFMYLQGLLEGGGE